MKAVVFGVFAFAILVADLLLNLTVGKALIKDGGTELDTAAYLVVVVLGVWASFRLCFAAGEAVYGKLDLGEEES